MILFQTERLLVRQLQAEDLDGFVLLSSDPVAMRYIRPVITREVSKIILEKEIGGYRMHPQAGRFAIADKSTGRYIGNYLVRPSSFMGGTEVGYALFPHAWGHGFATELTKKAVHFVLQDLQHPRVYAITDPRNEASKKVLFKSGFTQQRNFIDSGIEKSLFQIIQSVPPVITQRLTIIPLTYEQLRTYLQGRDLLEKELRLTKTQRNVSASVKDSVQKDTLLKMVNAAAEHIIYYTFWLVVDTASRIIVAELGFKGPPNLKKEVEIGYGTMPGYEGKGYMTEAVGGMITWAQQRNDIASVLASISKDNLASQRIAEKNKFSLFHKTAGMHWFKKDVRMKQDKA